MFTLIRLKILKILTNILILSQMEIGENKIILIEKKKPTQDILKKSLTTTEKKEKPFLDVRQNSIEILNCLMTRGLIS